MSLLNFKIILTESLINRFSPRKRNITAEKSQLTVELQEPLKEPDRIAQFTEKRQRCQYCFTNGKKGCKVLHLCAFVVCPERQKLLQIVSFFLRAIVQSHDMLMNF